MMVVEILRRRDEVGAEMSKIDRERECVCVVCMREGECKRESVCVRDGKRVCVNVRERERGMRDIE